MQEINNISLFFIKWKAKVISVMMVFLVTQIHFRYFISSENENKKQPNQTPLSFSHFFYLIPKESKHRTKTFHTFYTYFIGERDKMTNRPFLIHFSLPLPQRQKISLRNCSVLVDCQLVLYNFQHFFSVTISLDMIINLL